VFTLGLWAATTVRNGSLPSPPVTIPGRGDLAPPRRSSYGYRRRRTWPRIIGGLVLVAALAVGGWFGWQHWHDSGGNGSAATATDSPAPCPSPSFATTLSAHPTPVLVLNGTKRDGLAHDLAKVLGHGADRLPIHHVGNAPRSLHGDSVVRFAPADRFEAWLAAGRMQPTARLVEVNGLRNLEVEIGSAYKRIASPAEFTSAVHAIASRVLGCAAAAIHVAG
jgi:hypothetical protein